MEVTCFDSGGTTLVIYDISNNRLRTQFAKLMSSYGTRVQKSAFEINIRYNRLASLEKQFSQYIEEGDSIRLYHSNGTAKSWGNENLKFTEDSMIFV